MLEEHPVEVPIGELIGERDRVGDGSDVGFGRDPESDGEIREREIQVDQHALQPTSADRRSEVRNEEGRSDTPTGSVDGDDRRTCSSLTITRTERAGRRPREIAAIRRPQVEPPGAGSKRPAERLDGLGRVNGEQRAPVQLGRRRDPGGSHHRVRLELPHGLAQLMLVRSRRNDAGAARSIEEVHDLLGHIVLLEREDDRGNLLHPQLRSRRGKTAPTGKPRERFGGAATGPSCMRTLDAGRHPEQSPM